MDKKILKNIKLALVIWSLTYFLFTHNYLSAQLIVTGAGGETVITLDGGTLQLSAIDGTTEAINSVWSVFELEGHITTKATIDPLSGLLSANSNGNGVVRVKVVSDAKEGFLDITLSNQALGITVQGTDNVSEITTFAQTLQMIALLGANPASDITWTVLALDGNETDKATINKNSGLLSSIKNGEVLVLATNNRSNKSGNLKIIISGQTADSSNFVLSTTTGMNVVDIKKGQLQFIASNDGNIIRNAVWSVTNALGGVTSVAIINSNTGLLTALEDGSVIVKASKNGRIGNLEIIITGQTEQLIVTGDRGILSLDESSSLLMKATNFDNQEVPVTWEIKAEDGNSPVSKVKINEDLTDSVTINNEGLLTSVSSLGIVTVIATSTLDDSVKGSAKVTIKSKSANYTIDIQASPPTQMSPITIDTPGGTLQFVAHVSPSTSIGFIWSLWQESINPRRRISSNSASIKTEGSYNEIATIKAISNGNLIVRAALSDDKLKFNELIVKITNQTITNIPVTSITISPSEEQAVINEPKGLLQFRAQIEPDTASDKSVIWSIKTGINLASIDANGLLKAKGVDAGEVTIIATSNSTPDIKQELKVMLKNIVPNVLVQSINLVNDNLEEKILAGTEFSLRTIINPVNASSTNYTWEISNSNYVTLVGLPENNTFKAVRPTEGGKVYITAIANDASKTVSNAYVVVIDPNPDKSVMIEVLGLKDELISSLNIKVYPNPVSNELQIELNGDRFITYVICNQNGSTVESGTLFKREMVYVGDLPHGLYFVKFDDDEYGKSKISFIKK